MEERKLNEKESLELITQMIQHVGVLLRPLREHEGQNGGKFRDTFFAVGICNGNYLVAGLVSIEGNGQ